METEMQNLIVYEFFNNNVWLHQLLVDAFHIIDIQWRSFIARFIIANIL